MSDFARISGVQPREYQGKPLEPNEFLVTEEKTAQCMIITLKSGADHLIEKANAPWDAKRQVCSFNIWSPGTRVSPRNTGLPPGSWREKHPLSIERRMDCVAWNSMSAFYDGADLFFLQEVAEPGTPNFDLLVEKLKYHMHECNRLHPDRAPIELDLEALRTSWVRRGTDAFGTACLINKRVLSLVPVDAMGNLAKSVVGNGCMVEYHICHKQTGSVYKCVNAHSKGFTSPYSKQSRRNFEQDRNLLQHLLQPGMQDADSYLIMEVARGIKGDASCGGFDLNDFVYTPAATDRMEVYPRAPFKQLKPIAGPDPVRPPVATPAPAVVRRPIIPQDRKAESDGFLKKITFKDRKEAFEVIRKLALQLGTDPVLGAQLSDKCIHISDPRLVEPLQKAHYLHVNLLDAKYYDHKLEDRVGGRPHRYTIFDKVDFQPLKMRYGSSNGDYVKTQILKEIKYELDQIDNIDEFKKKKAHYNDKNLSYKALNTSQDWFTQSFFGKLFGIKTSSIIAFNKIVSEREAELEREAQFEL